MPIHDWTRVRANRFHHFHQTWTTNLAAALNSGRLPPGYFALAEQIKKDGTPPFSMGIEAGGGSGFPASDVIQQIVLNQEGDKTYDAIVDGTKPFNDSPAFFRVITSESSSLPFCKVK